MTPTKIMQITDQWTANISFREFQICHACTYFSGVDWFVLPSMFKVCYFQICLVFLWRRWDTWMSFWTGSIFYLWKLNRTDSQVKIMMYTCRCLESERWNELSKQFEESSVQYSLKVATIFLLPDSLWMWCLTFHEFWNEGIRRFTPLHTLPNNEHTWLLVQAKFENICMLRCYAILCCCGYTEKNLPPNIFNEVGAALLF